MLDLTFSSTCQGTARHILTKPIKSTFSKILSIISGQRFIQTYTFDDYKFTYWLPCKCIHPNLYYLHHKYLKLQNRNLILFLTERIEAGASHQMSIQCSFPGRWPVLSSIANVPNLHQLDQVHPIS